jgi:hypothetical protein
MKTQHDPDEETNNVVPPNSDTEQRQRRERPTRIELASSTWKGDRAGPTRTLMNFLGSSGLCVNKLHRDDWRRPREIRGMKPSGAE